MVSVLACITGCFCVLVFMVFKRGKTMRHGNVFIISLGLLTLLLWTFAIGLERALAVWAVQIMASGVILSTSFALLDARKSSDTK